MLDGIRYIEDFIQNPNDLFEHLSSNVQWDERMAARKTASFGMPYNYSQIQYPYQEFSPELLTLLHQIEITLGFRPNNCLMNYYLDGSSKMGFHSDQTDILEGQTGVVIISIGATRTLRFRNIEDTTKVYNYDLPTGSLFYMTQEVQGKWQHAIPKSSANKARISLSFRQLKPEASHFKNNAQN